MHPKLMDFEGHWTLRRQITQEQAPDGTFDGSARFIPDAAGLRYTEEGHLTIAGHAPVLATRRYLWRSGDGGSIDVFFEDGRAFHQIAPDAPQDRHWCDPDLYKVRYDFSRWPDWTAEWQVSGPRKAYRMISAYHPK